MLGPATGGIVGVVELCVELFLIHNSKILDF